MINLVSQLRVEIPEGIVRESGKVKHSIETLKVGGRNVPDVFAN